MEVSRSGEDFVLTVSNAEFNLLKNCINEAREALPEEEFGTRVGWEKTEAVRVLHFMLDERRRLREGDATREADG